eukprot:TRINITY_DN10225_c0_g1_i13.p1 TRINITY_DN10225_c0_g1~~TRINITY_DN10225_c0_g1_i13.p1  ORF type:complete len:893 (+),score=190.28 TRINITY_DN10225_c0_g1_i13:299-2680(+)
MEHVRSYLLNLKRITTHYCVSSGGLSKEVATSWEHVYSLRRDFYSTIRTYPSVTTVSYFAKGGAHIILWEVADTMLLDDDAYHHVQAFVSNGSAYDADAGGKPASKRTIWGEVEPDWTGDIHKWGTNFEPCDFEYRTHTRLNTSVPLKAPCGARSHADIVAYALAPVVPMHTTYFMGIATKVTHLMMQLACEFGSTATGETHGAVFLAMEMGSIQSFLQTLRFGTAEYGRIYIVVQSTQELVGTSSGLPYGFGMHRGHYSKLPIPAKNCTDTLVAQSAEQLEEVDSATGKTGFDTFSESGSVDTLNLTTSRTPSGEVFFVGVKTIDILKGPNWHVVTLLDEQNLLGSIKTAQVTTRQHVQQRQDEVDNNLNHARNVLYIALAVASVVPVLLAVVLVFRVTQPLMVLVHNMSRVAVLDLEGAQTVQSSLLAEVDGMNESFQMMVKNLVEYKQYLPQSVLLMSSEDEKRSECSRRTTQSNGRLSSASSNSSPKSKGHVRVEQPAVLLGDVICVRHITMLVSNIIGSHAMSPDTLKDAMSQHVACFMACAKARYGVPEVTGDKVVVCFNTILNTSRHKVQAAELASGVREKLSDVLNLSMAAATGSATCGNFGCTGLKKYAVFGSVATTAHALERFGRSYRIPIVCDGSIAADTESLFFLRRIARVFTNCGSTTMLHELADAKSLAAYEWMYQMEYASLNDPYRPVNAAVEAIYSFNLEHAKECLDKATVGKALAVQLLDHAQALRAPPPPVDLFAQVPLCPDQWSSNNQEDAAIGATRQDVAQHYTEVDSFGSDS